MEETQIQIIAIIASCISLGFAAFLAWNVVKQDEGSEQIRFIGKAIQKGAMAFLSREYRLLAGFVVVVANILALFIDYDILNRIGDPSESVPGTAIAYLAGAIGSGFAGFIGMSIAVRANTRTTVQAMKGLNPALRVAFNSGTVMGLSVVGLALIGITLMLMAFNNDVGIIAGFGFGASSIALFARVGGGIFTKAADVGADLVGKIEQGIPEDDPRNPATIADNVGDNVGDVAGMGADLFESYIGSIVAAVALASTAGALTTGQSDLMLFPLLVASIGIIASILGTFLVRTGENADMGRLLWSLRTGIFSAGILVLIGTAAVILYLDLDFDLFYVVLIGLVAGQLIGTASEYYTSYEYSPTRKLAEQSETGPATIIIGGLGLGMMSTVIPGIVIVAAMWGAYALADVYGIALAAVGMLSTLGITLATDAYGPVADNAGGIAEQAGLDPAVRERTDALDALGNTTAATGKGFAIGSAVLTSLALMAAYAGVVKEASGQALELNLTNPEVMIGLIIGSIMPFVFSALTMQAVGRAAYAMVQEVRRQFREIKGLLEGTAEPDYARAVDISTAGAMKEMVLPGIIAILVPILVGVWSVEALGGLLMGSIATGFLFAIMMANAGGAWDNAKKYIESGKLGGKGSDQHSAAIVGDTVGDPFKDTSGPALNILLKLMSIVALVFGPLFIGQSF
jgi:K(+)-stimulated pyrophosphate-energized sodium pump